MRQLGVFLCILTFAQCATRDPLLLRRAERGGIERAGRERDEDRDRDRGRDRSRELASPVVFEEQGNQRPPDQPRNTPHEHRLQRAGSFDGDLRNLPDRPARKRERPEREGPTPTPTQFQGAAAPAGGEGQALNAPAPGPTASFDGLDFATWGAGHPPDTNGDVGPSHYIQTVNSSIGIYDKATGNRVAAFTFDTFMSQGNFNNLCDTDNFGDPVALYDTFEDRWVITDFAFQLNGSNDVVTPPGAFQCFAVSKTGDPVAGGWNFYSINTDGGLGDYPKLGIWPDGLYMSVNMFDYAAAGSFQNVRLYALNKMQMYAGAPAVQVVSFDVAPTEFTLLPSNARLQTGTPPPGTPNYFTSIFNYLNVVSVWKFHVDWNSISLSSLTGPFNAITPTNWSQLTTATVPSPSPGNRLDTLYPRLMVQNQYSNIGGIESLWNSHTVGASGTSSAQSAPRFYELRVTGGTVAANTTQSFTYSPDATNRFMPSVAVDRAGNMAIGYSASSTSVYPSLRYAGRLAGDASNTITQTETTLFAGTGTQTGNCGGTSCVRWGDYSAMTLDPNGCTFWYTNEYYQTNGLNNRTRIGSFNFAACSPITVGSLQGTVRNSSNAPIAGAIVTLGSRTRITDANGNYSFSDLPAGTYPGVNATANGYGSAAFSGIVINSGATTTRDFVLGSAAQSGCFVDTTQADFQMGVATNCDMTGTPGSISLLKPSSINQQNLTVTSNGFAFNATTWAGQTFTPSITGTLTRVDLDLFCSGCTGTTPNISVSIRATSGSPLVPSGADLATATITGFSSGAGGLFSAVFSAPVTLTAGTRYAIVMHPVSNPSAGTYAFVCSCGNGQSNTNPYVNGQFVTSTNSGASWSADTTAGGRDLAFVAYMQTGFASSGSFISSTKDANPAAGKAAAWGTLSWTATVPANTSLTVQAAASNNVNGPFNFVGPDGTANSFFANGASLAQFNGLRYLKYKVLLTSSNSGVTPTIQDVTLCFNNIVDAATVTATVVSGGTRLQQLQNADGGWVFRVGDATCGSFPSCQNTIGITALALLSDYDRTHNASVLDDAVQAGQLLKSIHDANPSIQPFSQDLEFLVALSAASGDARYSNLATTWFTTVPAVDPNPADRADWNFSVRANKAVAVWDIASLIRMAKAAGNVSYATGLANRVVARQAEWNNGTGPVLLAMGSMLWAIHDLPGFDTQITSYRSWLLAHQDTAGSWDGDLQTTSYVAMGLGAVGGTGTSAAIDTAVQYFMANQFANGGFPFSAGGTNEYTEVDSEVVRAIDRLYNTQQGQGVEAFSASQLATVEFSDVNTAGSTTVVAVSASGALPWGYQLAPGLTYQVSTSADVNGSSTVCFAQALTNSVADARILHLENGRFVDRTTTDNCASVESLDTFAIGQIDPNAIDSEAPAMTVSLSPAVISQTNNKMITVTATIAVRDNADASPVVTLISITSAGGNGNKKDDVDAAAFGTDDREFSVRAEKGKTYTVVYRATDRSGNAADVASQIVVTK